tara:strand:+ start:397 stop:960 length:564 start_codon:yes stop_codon:yes gene_type:complete
MATNPIRYPIERNSQAEDQRDAYSTTFGQLFGQSNNTQLLFQHSDNPMKDSEASALFKTETISNFANLEEIVGFENPDFEDNQSLLYDGTNGMLTSTSEAPDAPNLRGPNLRVPKLNQDGSVDTTGLEQTGAEFDRSRGYGVKSHQEGGSITLNRYISRKEQSAPNTDGPAFGEYNQSFTTDYNWTE